MRAEELMIGDWVKTIHDVELRVEGNGIREALNVLLEDALYYSEDDIEPIPITPEILKKNGFEKGTNSYCLEISFREQIDIRECTANPDYKWIAHFSTHPFSGTAFINNVHELQHLLRDAKIEKEIEL